MSQSRVKVGRKILRPTKAGWSTWNLIEKGPEFIFSAVQQPKINFVGPPWKDFESFSKKCLATPLLKNTFNVSIQPYTEYTNPGMRGST